MTFERKSGGLNTNGFWDDEIGASVCSRLPSRVCDPYGLLGLLRRIRG